MMTVLFMNKPQPCRLVRNLFPMALKKIYYRAVAARSKTPNRQKAATMLSSFVGHVEGVCVLFFTGILHSFKRKMVQYHGRKVGVPMRTDSRRVSESIVFCHSPVSSGLFHIIPVIS